MAMPPRAIKLPDAKGDHPNCGASGLEAKTGILDSQPPRIKKQVIEHQQIAKATPISGSVIRYLGTDVAVRMEEGEEAVGDSVSVVRGMSDVELARKGREREWSDSGIASVVELIFTGASTTGSSRTSGAADGGSS